MSLAGFLLACLCGTSLGDFLSMPFAGAAKKCNWKRNNAHHKTFKWGGGTAPTPHQLTTAAFAQQATNPTLHSSPPYPPTQGVMRIRITCLCALTEWHTWIGLVDGGGRRGRGGIPVPPTTITSASRVLGLWLVCRTQHSQMSQSAFHCSLSWRIYDGYFTQNRLPLPGLSARTQIAVERAKKPSCEYNKSHAIISTRGRCAIISLNYLNRIDSIV